MRKSLYAMPLLAAILAACGNSATPSTSTEATTGSTAATAAATAAPAETAIATMEATTEATMEATTAATMEATMEATTAATAAGAASTDDSNCASADVFCIGLVTDVGKVDDKSFNQSAWEGVKEAGSQYGAVVNYIETTNPNDYASNIALFGDKSYDVIVTVGFALGEATGAAADEYKEVKFVGVDQFQAEPKENYAGLIFNEDKAGFLAGALAAQLSKTGTIAAVLGTDLVPPVVAFKEGYELGAKYVKPDIKLISTYHPGGLDVAFTDPEWGATTAKQALDQGADVVFGAGGKTGNGALIEVASSQGKYCIGVDSDQWETVPEAHPCLISSAMKLITPGVVELVGKAKDNSFPSGNYIGKVGLAPFHDFDSTVSADIKAKLDEIKTGLDSGTLETGYKPQ